MAVLTTLSRVHLTCRKSARHFVFQSAFFRQLARTLEYIVPIGMNRMTYVLPRAYLTCPSARHFVFYSGFYRQLARTYRYNVRCA